MHINFVKGYKIADYKILMYFRTLPETICWWWWIHRSLMPRKITIHRFFYIYRVIKYSRRNPVKYMREGVQMFWLFFFFHSFLLRFPLAELNNLSQNTDLCFWRHLWRKHKQNLLMLSWKSSYSSHVRYRICGSLTYRLLLFFFYRKVVKTSTGKTKNEINHLWKLKFLRRPRAKVKEERGGGNFVFLTFQVDKVLVFLLLQYYLQVAKVR